MKKLLFGLVLVGLAALGPVQAAIQDGRNHLVELVSSANAPEQMHVDTTCESLRISAAIEDCGIELRSPAELAADAGQG